jgi:glucose-1-phosphatase
MKVNLTGINAIIFDLGGVILSIDYQKTIDAFIELGINDFQQLYTQANQTGIFDDFETGRYSEKEFVAYLSNKLPSTITQSQIIDAWNAMLLSWDERKLNLIAQLNKSYRIFLFSNTNEIHKNEFLRTLQSEIGIPSLNNHFEKAYYSHELGKRKPHPESFIHILNENQLTPSTTLFIDDSIQHIEGAKKVGLKTIHIQEESILQLFS